jgi:hypothetical protein
MLQCKNSARAAIGRVSRGGDSSSAKLASRMPRCKDILARRQVVVGSAKNGRNMSRQLFYPAW